MAIEVRPVRFPQDAATFVKVWWRVYRDDPHWVPPLIFERKKYFDPNKNPYYEQAEVQGFIAYKDGEAVGTIGACHDRDFEKQMPGFGTFGFFEFIDDVEVARGLLEAAKDWLRDRGLERITGPFNFSSNHEFGLVVDGFGTDPCVANPHNSAHYPRIYKELGLNTNMTWYAYWLDQGPEPPRIFKIVDRIMKRNSKISVRSVNLSKWDSEMEIVRDVYNDAWHENWGHVPIRPKEFDYLAKDLKALVQEDLCYVVEVDGEVAGMSVTFPDLNQVAKKMNGRLLPVGWWHYVTGKASVNKIRVFILGVKTEFQHLPLGAIMYAKTWEAGLKRKILGAEASLILHDNVGMRGAMEKMGGYVYKTYQTFEAKLVPGAPDVQTNPGVIIPAKPIGYSLTDEGKEWLANRPALQIRKPKKAPAPADAPTDAP